MIGCSLWLFLVVPAAANPNVKAPEATLDLHNVTKSQEILTPALPLLTQCVQTIPNLPELGERNSPTTLSKLHVALRQVRRAVLDLQLHGETAGYDLELRIAPMEARLRETVERFKNSKIGPPNALKAHQAVSQPKAVQARAVALKKLEELLQQERWADGYAQLNAVMDELTSVTMFLGGDEERQILIPFGIVNGNLTSGRNNFVRKQVRQALQEVIQSQLPDRKGALAALAAAAAALRTAPTADVEGQRLDGPQSLQHFGNLWLKLQVAWLRCRAIEWARRAVVPSLAYVTPVTEPNPFVDTEYEKFADESVKALAALIEADAARAAGPEVAKLHAGYLQTAAPLVCQTIDDKLPLALAPALDKLAAKSPELARDVADYRSATAEALRWRARVAATRAASQANRFTPGDKLLLAAATSKTNYRGLFPETDARVPLAALLGSCPEVLSGAGPALLGKPISLPHIAGLSGGETRRRALSAAPFRDPGSVPLGRPDSHAPTGPAGHRSDVTADAPGCSSPRVCPTGQLFGSRRRGHRRVSGGPDSSICHPQGRSGAACRLGDFAARVGVP
jgi:hypothetical protein